MSSSIFLLLETKKDGAASRSKGERSCNRRPQLYPLRSRHPFCLGTFLCARSTCARVGRFVMHARGKSETRPRPLESSRKPSSPRYHTMHEYTHSLLSIAQYWHQRIGVPPSYSDDLRGKHSPLIRLLAHAQITPRRKVASANTSEIGIIAVYTAKSWKADAESRRCALGSRQCTSHLYITSPLLTAG